jgi:DNA mismatch endonuclease (patch repair protein)
VPKLARNVERDREQDAALEAAGWAVVRIWEHVPVAKAVEQVAAALSSAPA